MNSKEPGLTVGELTTFIGVIIIGILLWTTFTQNKNSQESSETPKALYISSKSIQNLIE